jgi:hypothetical protein
VSPQRLRELRAHAEAHRHFTTAMALELLEHVGQLERERDAAGRAADSIDSLIHALRLNVPAHIHLEGIRGTLPEILRDLRKVIDGGGR